MLEREPEERTAWSKASCATACSAARSAMRAARSSSPAPMQVRWRSPRSPRRARLEHARERAGGARATDPRRELGDDHLADPVVNHLDGLDARRGSRCARSAGLARGRWRRRRSSRMPAPSAAIETGSGRPADRDDLEQPAARAPGGARGAPSPSVRGSPPRSGRRVLGARDAARPGYAARELVDQEGAAARLEGDGVRRDRASSSSVPSRVSASRRVSARLERPDRDVSQLGERGPARARLEQEGAASAASSSRYVMRSRSGGASGGRTSSSSSAALSMSPHCTPSTKTTSGCLRASDARAARAARRTRAGACGSDRRRPARPCSRCSGRAAGPGRGARAPTRRAGSVSESSRSEQAHQVAAQRIDDAVDRLVRDRLALVGPAAQDDRLAALDQLVEEVLDERSTCPCPTGRRRGP